MGVKNSIYSALSITVSEIMASLRFRGHVTLRGYVTSKWKFRKLKFNRHLSSLRFALSLTVSEIMANLHHVTPKSIFSKVVIS